MTPEQRRKDIARSYAGVYLRRGYITREPCKDCGAEKAEMHHPDYDRPAEVEWMCRPCHMALHAFEKLAQFEKQSKVIPECLVAA